MLLNVYPAQRTTEEFRKRVVGELFKLGKLSGARNPIYFDQNDAICIISNRFWNSNKLMDTA
jgi:hypothetical protein